MAHIASCSRVQYKSASSSKNPLLCVGHQRGNRQEVAATGSPGTEKTGDPWDHSSAQHHGQHCLSLLQTNSVSDMGCYSVTIS